MGDGALLEEHFNSQQTKLFFLARAGTCPAAPPGYDLSPNMERFGDDLACYSGIDAQARGPDCSDVPACMAFSLVLASIDGNPRRCLKASAAPLQAAIGICFYTKCEIAAQRFSRCRMQYTQTSALTMIILPLRSAPSGRGR